MRKIITVFSLLLLAITMQAKVALIDLKCEYLINPEGVDMQHPRFFWKMKSDEKGQQLHLWRSKSGMEKVECK